MGHNHDASLKLWIDADIILLLEVNSLKEVIIPGQTDGNRFPMSLNSETTTIYLGRHKIFRSIPL